MSRSAALSGHGAKPRCCFEACCSDLGRSTRWRVAGEDLRATAWSERRARLEGLLGDATGAVRPTPVLELNPALHAALVADGFEGTVAKRTTGALPLRHRSNPWGT
jgi:hypothetical protein